MANTSALDEAWNASVRSGPELRCPMVAQPSYEQNREVLGDLGTILFCVGAVAVLFIFACYCDIVRHVLLNVPARFKAHSIMAVSVYPVMALVSYIAIVVPRFQLITEAVVMFTWMVALYQVFCLFVAYSGGETMIVKQVEAGVMDIQIAPCCCYPCCCFPKLDLKKSVLRIPRLLILQLSLVQGLVYLCLLVMWSEEETMYQRYYLYFQPLAIPSIFTSIWGMTMILRMMAPTLQPYHMYGKYVCLQMVLLFTKCQGTVARVVIMILQEPCQTDLSPSVLSYLICNGVFLLELMLLVMLARMFYLRPLPDDLVHASTNNNNHTTKPEKKGIDNVTFM